MPEIKPIALKDCEKLSNAYWKQYDDYHASGDLGMERYCEGFADALESVAKWARTNNTDSYRTALILIRDMVLGEKDPDEILGYINIMLDRG